MGLGTGRRGMKSPPLLLAVLLACVFVLGINYWITSSRCVELQTRVVDLESRMRRAAAERGAVEMKKNEYEEMLAKQKQQIDTIQSLHSSQMQNVHAACNSEKEKLLSNITRQANSLHKRLEECKLELKEQQESQAKKLSFELAQCSNKLAEAKEQCEELVRKASVKYLNTANEEMDQTIVKTEKLKPITRETNQQDANEDEGIRYRSNLAPRFSLLPTVDRKGAIIPPENEEETKDEDIVEKKPSAAPKQVEDREDDEQGPINEVKPDLANAAEEDDEPKVEDTVDKDSNKENENEEVERENLINLEGQQEEEKDAKLVEQEEDVDNVNYNGDETNQAEPETDKQAQLIDNEQNFKDEKIQNGLTGQGLDAEAEDSEDPPVK